MAPPRPRKLSQQERERLITRMKELLQRRTEIQLAVLHGSFHTADSFRDVDLALLVVDVPRERFRDYELEQGVRWSEQLGMPIDVRLLNDAAVAFRYHALGCPCSCGMKNATTSSAPGQGTSIATSRRLPGDTCGR